MYECVQLLCQLIPGGQFAYEVQLVALVVEGKLLPYVQYEVYTADFICSKLYGTPLRPLNLTATV